MTPKDTCPFCRSEVGTNIYRDKYNVIRMKRLSDLNYVQLKIRLERNNEFKLSFTRLAKQFDPCVVHSECAVHSKCVVHSKKCFIDHYCFRCQKEMCSQEVENHTATCQAPKHLYAAFKIHLHLLLNILYDLDKYEDHLKKEV